MEKEKFEVVMASDLKEDETVVLTMAETAEKWLAEAMQSYDPTNRQYSVYLNNNSSGDSNVTQDTLDTLAKNPQNDLDKTKRINSIVKTFINSDDIIGKTVESIETNVNTKYRLSYKNAKKDDNLDDAKEFIEDFNEQINVQNLIRNSVPSTYRDGTYIMYLRHDKDYVVDIYPLGVAEISNYTVGGEPCILININELRSRLSNNYPKTKKRRPLFFKDMDEEIKATYPKEVYDAYKNKEQYAKLDIRYSGVMRVGNLDGRYGLTPIFRSLYPALMLKQFTETDRITSKANSKKIIVQLLNKEIMGTNYDKDRFDLVSWCHNNLLSAWKSQTVLATSSPAVRDVKYVESKMELTPVQNVNSYRSKEMATLGVGFLMDSGSTSVSTASISVDQLLKCINKISEQLEVVLRKWYKQILADNGYDAKLAPKVNIIDSEQLDFDMRKDLATTLYTIFNGSMETSLEILGIDIDDEVNRRKSENNDGLDKIFNPRQTAYTSSGRGEIVDEKSPGRKDKAKDKNKEQYDEERNKTL